MKTLHDPWCLQLVDRELVVLVHVSIQLRETPASHTHIHTHSLSSTSKPWCLLLLLPWILCWKWAVATRPPVQSRQLASSPDIASKRVLNGDRLQEASQSLRITKDCRKISKTPYYPVSDCYSDWLQCSIVGNGIYGPLFSLLSS